MRAIIVDQGLDVTDRASQVLPALGIDLVFPTSIAELAATLRTSDADDVLLVDLSAGVRGAEIIPYLRDAKFAGRTLLLGRTRDAGIADLTAHPRLQFVVRPSSAAALDGLLRKLVTDAPLAARRGPEPAAVLPGFDGMVAKSRPMREIFSRIEKVAAGDASVCIYGESGTGKELIARAIHHHSARRHRPLVILDCTAVPEGLMESHLFGHVRGAFTGAVDPRDGVFSLAHTGTLFIDELSELSMHLQAKLLRVVQTREFFKVGGTRPVSTDIRLITATNKDPRRCVEAGTFREDLYYRVAVVMIKVPPLRERREDLPLLVEHFLRKFSALYHKPILAVEPSLMDRILDYPWPGNVRQLENWLQQAVVLAERDTIGEREFPLDERAEVDGGEETNGRLPGSFAVEPGMTLREAERRYILRTLDEVRGNRTRAAKLLGISLRGLQYKLKAYCEAADPLLPLNGSANGFEHGASVPGGRNE